MVAWVDCGGFTMQTSLERTNNGSVTPQFLWREILTAQSWSDRAKNSLDNPTYCTPGRSWKIQGIISYPTESHWQVMNSFSETCTIVMRCLWPCHGTSSAQVYPRGGQKESTKCCNWTSAIRSHSDWAEKTWGPPARSTLALWPCLILKTIW